MTAYRTFTTEHGEFRIQARDRIFGRNAGVAETMMARHFLSSPKSRVLVVGAHVGTVAIPLSLHCAEVVAIEANPETFMMLEANIATNKHGNIVAFQVAANDKNEEIEFVASVVNTGRSKRMPVFHDDDFFNDQPTVTKVRAARLDEYVGPLGPFDMVFMDCEGSEYFAFLGMPEILADAKTLIVEFYRRHIERVAAITVEQFIEPLWAFPVMLSPAIKELAIGEEVPKLLKEIQADDGLIFCKYAGRAKQLMKLWHLHKH